MCIFGGSATGWPVLQHAGYALAGIEVLAFAAVRAGRRSLLVTSSTDRTRLTAGDTIEERFHFEKGNAWPTAWIQIDPYRTDSFTSDEPIDLAVLGNSRKTVARRHVLRARGRYELGTAAVRIRDPLGVFSVLHQRLPPIEVTVYPRPIEVPEAAQIAREAAMSQHRWRLSTMDASVGDLRDYHSGDAPSRIHWRSTARRGTLTVSEPESQRPPVTWIFVDLGGDFEETEKTAGVAAYLVEKLFARGQSVGTLVAGAETVVVRPRPGRGQVARALEALALTESTHLSQMERLVQAAGQCENAGSFILVSAESGTSGYIRRLRLHCPSVRSVPLHSDTRRPVLS